MKTVAKYIEKLNRVKTQNCKIKKKITLFAKVA